MAFQINSTTVITDAVAINNVTGFDNTSAQAITRAVIQGTTLETGETKRAGRPSIASRGGGAALTPVTHSHFGFQQKGDVTFYHESLSTSASISSQATIISYRNGASATVATFTLTNTVYTARTSNQAVLPGDIFEFRIRGGALVLGKSTTNSTGRMQNSEIRTSTNTVYIPTQGSAVVDYFWFTSAQ